MNTRKFTVYENDVLLALEKRTNFTQRELADESGYSLGIINKCINSLQEKKLVDGDYQLTARAKKYIKERSPKRAIILAAGFGMRMVPINLERPKALLEVKGEVLIERHIRHLHEAGITEIYVVVGFMKEQFEYLIDEFGVELIVNAEYSQKNNLFSLNKAIRQLENCYIIPCDIYCNKNPYRERELYSWYMVTDKEEVESEVRVNRQQQLVKAEKDLGNRMVGICYITADAADRLIRNVSALCQKLEAENYFWEEALYDERKMIVSARVIDDEDVFEINTYEQLREFDKDSFHLQSETMQVIAKALGVEEDEIQDITTLKKGMTNRSFLFSCKKKKYIMRIPGEGTDFLISRKNEYEVYRAIAGKGLCDDPIYINPQNGYKITEYLDNARVCDPSCTDELEKSMEKLRQFHQMKLKVDHDFDLFGQIEFYESLWEGQPSVYKDYAKTKENVWSLLPFIRANQKEKVLTHIDAVPDNFLFYTGPEGEEIQLTDWEYAGMHDPDLDLAMFCIYSLYDKEHADQLISIYYKNGCDKKTRIKIYCYMAAAGLLWSNWCEYKSKLGVEFGEYSLRQYRYAKDYYVFASAEINEIQ